GDAADPRPLVGVERASLVLAPAPDAQRRLRVDLDPNELVLAMESLEGEELDVREEEGDRRAEEGAELDVRGAAGEHVAPVALLDALPGLRKVPPLRDR